MNTRLESSGYNLSNIYIYICINCGEFYVNISVYRKKSHCSITGGVFYGDVNIATTEVQYLVDVLFRRFIFYWAALGKSDYIKDQIVNNEGWTRIDYPSYECTYWVIYIANVSDVLTIADGYEAQYLRNGYYVIVETK